MIRVLFCYSLFFVFLYKISAQDIAKNTIQFQKTKLTLGGTLRYNYNYSSWNPNQKKRGGDLGFEVFRINADAVYKRWELHLDQRFYAASFGGSFLKYGWFQYNISNQSHIKFGLIPAYFGAQQFNSHSWFFQLPFYVGFEDDHDMGISYSLDNRKIQLDVGFYKNAELLSLGDNDPISDARYAYDFSGRNREINQINLRLNYKLGYVAKQKIGASFQYGGIWNLDTQEVGDHIALGIHYDLVFKRWMLKGQFISYHNRPKNMEGDSRDRIEMTAFGFPYQTATKATIYSIGAAYTIPIKKSFLKSIKIYNDYSYMDKSVSTWEDTQMNVLGFLINATPVQIHFDLGTGKNQPWLGPQWEQALTTGNPDQSWESRFNINLGYYF